MEPVQPFDFSGVLVVLGVAGVLLLIGLGLKHLQQRLLAIGIGQAADTIEGVLRLINDPSPHDLAVVHQDAWPPEARALLEAPLTDAASLGFAVLGDVEDRTVSRTTGTRALMRGLVHEDGVTMLTTIARPGPDGALKVALECGTELSSGRFVETIVADTPLLGAGPDVLIEQLPVSTTVTTLFHQHQGRVASLLDDSSRPVPVGDIDAAIQRAHRRLAVTAAARAAIPGGITRDELERLGTDSEPKIVDRIWAELRRRHASRGR